MSKESGPSVCKCCGNPYDAEREHKAASPGDGYNATHYCLACWLGVGHDCEYCAA